MQQEISLIELDIDDSAHLATLFSIRSHPDVIPFLRQTPPPDFSHHVHYLRSLGSEKRFFLVRSASTLVGYCQLTFICQEPTQVEIGMALHPDHCNQGIGSLALRLLLKRLPPESQVLLYVKKDNYRAMALYKKFGFNRTCDENEYGEFIYRLKNLSQ